MTGGKEFKNHEQKNQKDGGDFDIDFPDTFAERVFEQFGAEKQRGG
jgi:hypothetical protein